LQHYQRYRDIVSGRLQGLLGGFAIDSGGLLQDGQTTFA
jgi:hypothetical protein